MAIKSELIDKLGKDLKNRGFYVLKYYNKVSKSPYSDNTIPFIIVKGLIIKLYVYQKDGKLMVRGKESPNASYPRGEVHLEVEIADPKSFDKLFELLDHFKHATDYLKEHVKTIEGELG
jgi:hypothetical protein